MQDTQDSVPRADLPRRPIKRRPIKPRNPIQQLSADLDTIMLATGRSEKYLAGTMWSRDVEERDPATGKLSKKPSLPKAYYEAAIQQKEPRKKLPPKIVSEPFVG